MTQYKQFKNKLLKNRKVKKAYTDLGPDFALVEMIIQKRLQQGLTQAELARKLGTKQPLISRIEQGNYNPTVKLLSRIAVALNADLSISIS